MKSLAYRLAVRLSASLPSETAFRMAETFADAQWRSSRKDRMAVASNLSLIMGRDVPAFSEPVREVFRNFGRYLVEFFRAHRMPHMEVALDGEEHLMTARRSRPGVIGLTAHLGNWELTAIVLRRLGIPISAIALPHADPGMDRLFNIQRQRCGVGVIPLGDAAVGRALACLRDGRLLGILGDREFGDHALPVSLCGRPADVPRGPAMLSLRSGAPVVPIFLIREGRWRFRLCCEPAIWPESTGTPKASAVTILTQTYAAVIERYLQRFPTQWLIFRPVADIAHAPSSQPLRDRILQPAR